MHSFIAASVLLNVANASPLLFFRQAVTDVIAPSSPPPSGCLTSYDGVFGVSVQNITADDSSLSKRQWGDNGWGGSSGGPPGGAPGGRGGPQGGPQGGHRGGGGGHEWGDWDGKPDCNSTAQPVIPTTKRCTCEDPPAPTSYRPQPPPITVARVTQIGDGQIQGSLHSITMHVVNRIVDGQTGTWTFVEDGYNMPSSTVSPATANAGAVSPPPPTNAAATSGDYDSAASSDEGDGDTANQTATDSTGDDEADQTAAPTVTNTPSAAASSTAAASSDTGDAASPTNTPSTTPTSNADNSNPSDPSSDELIACRTNSSLQLHLSDSILTDSLGRTGYIASNYQFQFDNPPQSEALYTAGWSVCSNGSLALGGSTTFWQCLSGEFYNLYDRNWAAQCSPIEIRVVTLQDCGDEGAE